SVFGDAEGIAFTTGGTLNIENTVISSFSGSGVNDTAPGSQMWVHNCDVKKNNIGIYVVGAGTSAVIENSSAVENSSTGMGADNSATVVIRNSVAEGNLYGFFSSATGGASTEMIVDSCMSTNNNYGLVSQQLGSGS